MEPTWLLFAHHAGMHLAVRKRTFQTAAVFASGLPLPPFPMFLREIKEDLKTDTWRSLLGLTHPLHTSFVEWVTLILTFAQLFKKSLFCTVELKNVLLTRGLHWHEKPSTDPMARERSRALFKLCGRCYGADLHPLQNVYVEAPAPSWLECGSIWRWSLYRLIRVKLGCVGGPSSSGNLTGVLMRHKQKTVWGHRGNMAIYKWRREGSDWNLLHRHLDLGLSRQNSEDVNLFKPISPWCFVMAALTD